MLTEPLLLLLILVFGLVSMFRPDRSGPYLPLLLYACFVALWMGYRGYLYVLEKGRFAILPDFLPFATVAVLLVATVLLNASGSVYAKHLARITLAAFLLVALWIHLVRDGAIGNWVLVSHAAMACSILCVERATSSNAPDSSPTKKE
jgi:O-antigen/teichoic acid export membrane protein